MIRGVTVTLYERTQAGTDGFNRPIYTKTPVQVENVLITPTSAEEIVNDLQLYGRRSEYELSLPKGDAHDWENTRVMLPEPYSFAGTYMTVGFPVSGIDELVPLSWNQKVLLERYGH